MKVFVEKDYTSLSKKGAKIIEEVVRNKPDCVLGLATGSTPLGIYEELIRLHRLGGGIGLDFSKVTTFNLDEYCGLKKTDPQSYHFYMWENFFRHVNLKPENTFIPNANSEDASQECVRYEEAIEVRGGLDLQLLGLGRNGHIGFNEPDEHFVLDTHVVELSADTIKANSRFFSSEAQVPRYAMTMGIGSIMGAKKILLVVSGEGKEEVVRKILQERVVTPRIPASILHLHPDVTMLLDYKIASALGGLDLCE
ncbi:MAG TPA: glucosamine-6-phosphate deaminase [Firmicutes bacterium]|nr:glucosamine-6-phosphate deaminase [Bacillota bacterium]